MKKMIKTLILACVLLSASIAAVAQQKMTGVVTDDTGEPIIGATVVIKGTTTGTITDFNGAYNVTVDKGQTLIFSFIGMVSQDVLVANQSTINVTLQSEDIGLDEVVVIGYGEKKKVTVTGSVSTIGSDELIKSPSASVTNALAGKISGIASVQNSGQPGADEAALYIRGVATLNVGDASPLTIVDGVERPFSQIDPEEIESISVLKDASATAVYGVRGANGVIIVTTKRGQKGRTKISVSTSLGFQQPTMLPGKSNSYDYALGHNERNFNDGNPVESNFFSDEAIEAFKNGGTLLYPDTDWYDYIFKDYALQNKTNVTIRGGTDKVRYFAALGYLSQDGLLKDLGSKHDGNYTYNRYNYRSNLDIDVTQSTLLKITFGGRTEVRNQPRTTQQGIWKEAAWAQPMGSPGIIDGNIINTSQEQIPIQFRVPLKVYYNKGYSNQTKSFLDLDIDLIQKLDFITKGLKFKVKGSYNTNYTYSKHRSTSPDSYNTIIDPENPLKDPNEPGYKEWDKYNVVFRKTGDASKLSYSQSTGKARNWYVEAALNYNRKFGYHDFGGLLLYNQRVVYYPQSITEIPNRLLGLVGRLTYNYKTKYLLDLNLGYNGSENFPEAKRFGLFPAVSLGWIVTEESFMQGLDFLNYFKIRGSYGLVGNDRAVNNHRFLYLPDSWNYSVGGYNFGYDNNKNQPGAMERLIGNPNVTWETATKKNIGFDAKFLNARLGASFDYFHELRKDILIQRQIVPGYVAAELPVVNLGEVENQGYEVELKWNDKIGNDFSYHVSVNMSYARNKINYKDEIPQPFDYLYETGNPVGQPFGYTFLGFFDKQVDTTNPDDPNNRDPNNIDPNTGDMLPYANYGGVMNAGDAMYLDINKDGKIDDFDMKPIGYSTRVPEYNYGINAGFVWKGLDFSMTIAGVKNTSRSLPSYYRNPFGGKDRGLFSHLYEGRWTQEKADAGVNIEYPRFSTLNEDKNYRDSELWVRDASFMRLKNVELGYTLKSRTLKKVGISNVRFFVNGFNLLTFSEFDFFDPESGPGDRGLYPMTKVYNTGVKFNF
ncbi:SusC/RagA family TonB-linked outer membrane protein [Carboxylicivirga marina]|uniref:TonB-dependent receptor n=1 Tax=Carboxylicivirga marina TaxID=2800988 RepID=A0ABS1HMJ5_9BACT|nr:TonB-dependent receptor [Carboxylicivirga marina]MBK3518889.1 TonB-dependent receptor [Carboxylicivirga marina]